MQITDDAALLHEIEAFLKRNQLAPSRFGREAMGDAGLVHHLRNGRSLTLKTASKVVSFMASYEKESA